MAVQEHYGKEVSQGGSAVISLESQRKGGFGNRFRELAVDKLPLPFAPLFASLWGPLEFRRGMPVGEGEGGGKGTGMLPGGRTRLLTLN